MCKTFEPLDTMKYTLAYSVNVQDTWPSKCGGAGRNTLCSMLGLTASGHLCSNTCGVEETSCYGEDVMDAPLFEEQYGVDAVVEHIGSVDWNDYMAELWEPEDDTLFDAARQAVALHRDVPLSHKDDTSISDDDDDDEQEDAGGEEEEWDLPLSSTLQDSTVFNAVVLSNYVQQYHLRRLYS